jgi:hypothetical protein
MVLSVRTTVVDVGEALRQLTFLSIVLLYYNFGKMIEFKEIINILLNPMTTFIRNKVTRVITVVNNESDNKTQESQA